MIAEARRAGASFALSDASGTVIESGEAEAVIGDDALIVGPVTVSFLDADVLSAADYSLQLQLWPGGRLVLSKMGRRFDTFTEELRRVRNESRVAGLLAHGITMPEVFPGALLSAAEPRPSEFRVYDTHVTVVPADGDPWQLPLGAVTVVRSQREPPGVVLSTALLAVATGGPRLGFVQLLDPDGEGLRSPAPLPENWAVFLLVPVGRLTVLEILAGPAAATYVFRGEIDAVNRDLQLLHFRRAPLALTAEQAELTPSNPQRLALRRLEPLQRLRSTTVARVIHNEGWEQALGAAL